MITVAVLGPKDLIDRVTALGKQFHTLNFVPYPYASERETPAILRACADACDIVLFTGPVPYAMARRDNGLSAHGLDSEKVPHERGPQETLSPPMFYVSYSSGALHVVLLSHIEAYGRRKGDPLRMSVDTLEVSSVHEMLDEFGGDRQGVYVYGAEGTPTEADLVAFHHTLYEQGKTDFAVTGLTSAYQRLCALGVPTYRLTITDAAIRVALSLVEMRAHTMTQRDGELCVGTVRVVNGAAVLQDTPSEYENRRLRLMLMNQFVDFCEEIKASIRIDDDDTYVFFANRGAVERDAQGHRAMLFMEKVQKALPFEICVGLGYGHSAHAAEQNSREALRHAMQGGRSCLTSMLADGTLRAIRPGGPAVTYVSRTEEPWILALAEASRMSINVITKIHGSVAKEKDASFSANDVADALGTTLRSARRILQRLEEAGGIVSVGKEQPPGAGRPRRIYRFSGDAGAA